MTDMKWETPSWKDLLGAASMVLIGFMLGFFYLWLGIFWTFVGSLVVLAIVLWSFNEYDKRSGK